MRTPKWLASPNTTDLVNGDLSVVSWSKDGKSLYATGSYRDDKYWNIVFKYSGKNLSKRDIAFYGASTIIDAAPYNAGGIALNITLPEIAIIDEGKLVLDLNSTVGLMGKLGTNAIKTAQQQAASFNTAGDSGIFTPGTSADSKYARSIAIIKFWDTIPPTVTSASVTADEETNADASNQTVFLPLVAQR